jgi:hypothetical protein
MNPYSGVAVLARAVKCRIPGVSDAEARAIAKAQIRARLKREKKGKKK